MRVDVIVNPAARRYERSPSLVGELREAARGRAVFHATRDLDELRGVCEEAAAAGSELVVLTGGDGSLMAGTSAVVRAFGERLPRIGFLPAGTAAVVSRNWGLRGEPRALLSRILAGGRDLAVDRRPTLRVRAEVDGGEEERIGFIFGTGLVAKFFELYYEDGARGNAGAARLVARIFVESFVGGSFARRVLDPLPCTIEVDGRALRPRAFSLVCAAVIRDLGLHMCVTHRAAEDPSRPHLVASALPSRRLGWRMPLVLAGRPIGGDDAFDDLARDFTVRFPKTGTDPSAMGPYVLDGDMLRARAVHVSAGPMLEVVKP
ncbi:MAG: diacylglycerol kinase family protein [Polyangiaceae bacterium]